VEGIADAQRYRQTPVTPTDVKKAEDKDRDTKVLEVEQDKRDQRQDEGEPKFDARAQQQFQQPEGAQEAKAQAPTGDGQIPAGGDGTIYINKGGSKITDAKAVIAIAEICAGHNQTDIKADELQKELAAKGIESYVSTVDGKPALKFDNGDVFVDSSGNNALGLEDGDFGKALQQIEQKYGINLDGLEMKVKDIVDKRNAQNDNKDNADLAGLLGGLDGINGLNGLDGMDGLGQDGQNPQGAGDMTAIFEDLDNQLQGQGYQGPQAQELYDQGNLEPTLYQYGIQMPEAPQADNPEAQAAKGHTFANDMFNAALLISTIKQPTFTA
jgi:hypothetical protein